MALTALRDPLTDQWDQNVIQSCFAVLRTRLTRVDVLPIRVEMAFGWVFFPDSWDLSLPNFSSDLHKQDFAVSGGAARDPWAGLPTAPSCTFISFPYPRAAAAYEASPLSTAVLAFGKRVRADELFSAARRSTCLSFSVRCWQSQAEVPDGESKKGHQGAAKCFYSLFLRTVLLPVWSMNFSALSVPL